MYAKVENPKENKSQSVANGISQKQRSSESSFQFVDNRPKAVAQRELQKMANNSPQAERAVQLQIMADNYIIKQQQLIQKKESYTGLPDNLKTGMENLSGMSLDDVKVHHNSDKPGQLQAHAYAQGTDIHLATGQEKHLAHELGHVVQQAQGRVQATTTVEGVAVNDSTVLEKEADKMGTKALQRVGKSVQNVKPDPVTETKATAMGDKVLNQTAHAQNVSQSKRISGSVIQGQFQDSSQVRKANFIRLAEERYKVSQDDAEILYTKGGGDDTDPATGLGTPEDKEETENIARQYVDAGKRGEHTNKMFYTKIKFRNLAGLNAARGHAGADEIFRLMADVINGEMRALSDQGAEVRGYRHEGSRFGFLVHGNEYLTKEMVETVLNASKQTWEKMKLERNLGAIANPKRSAPPGIDLDYTVFPFQGASERGQGEKEPEPQAQALADRGYEPILTDRSFQGPALQIFRNTAQQRKHDFTQYGENIGLSSDKIRELYTLAGKADKESLTGFERAGDRVPTMLSAMKFFQDYYPYVYAGYVEVDVRNLGGLNDNLTRADSDNVFRFMAHTTDEHVNSLNADVSEFRHGGDEFSFVVVGLILQIRGEDIRTVLSEAQRYINAYVKTKKIKQTPRKTFVINGVTGYEIELLNNGIVPAAFDQKLKQEKIVKNNAKIHTYIAGSNWYIRGPETYWVIGRHGNEYMFINIPLTLTLDEILHSKHTLQKPRLPGTGIVWGVSSVLKSDVSKAAISPIDVIARADQEVEHKKV